MTYEVHKYEQTAPLADGHCTCGRAVRYNLTVPVIAHVDDGTLCPGDVDIAGVRLARAKDQVTTDTPMTRGRFAAALAGLLTAEQQAEIKRLHDQVEEAWLDGCAAHHDGADCCVDAMLGVRWAENR